MIKAIIFRDSRLSKKFSSVSTPHGSYYSAEFIFFDFLGQNELFSLTNQCGFSISCNHTRNMGSETNL